MRWPSGLWTILYCKTFTEFFLSLTIPLISLSIFLTWLLSIWLGSTLQPLVVVVVKGRRLTCVFQRLWFLCLSWESSSPSIFSQACSQKAVLSWHGSTLQIPPFGLGERWLGTALRGWCCGPSPITGPARIRKSFQLPWQWVNEGRRGGEEAFWIHFTVTHIPPFYSECLNMKTTQLLLTPAPPPKHSSSD